MDKDKNKKQPKSEMIKIAMAFAETLKEKYLCNPNDKALILIAVDATSGQPQTFLAIDGDWPAMTYGLSKMIKANEGFLKLLEVTLKLTMITKIINGNNDDDDDNEQC